jgi:hypothetical protein
VKKRDNHVDEEGVLALLLRLLRGQLVEFEYEILVRLLVHVRRVDENLIVEEGKVVVELELGRLKIHRLVIRRGVRPLQIVAESLAGRAGGDIYLIGYYGLLCELWAALYNCRRSEEGEYMMKSSEIIQSYDHFMIAAENTVGKSFPGLES